MNTPLAGITVLDFGQIFQGPYATLLMAKAGANVIKIEPPHGEPGRRRAAPGKSATLPVAMLNANKRAITLNLKSERGRALLRQMVERADVLLENFSPGTMDDLGVGYEVLKTINPRLVYATGSGYGITGPDRDNLAMDFTIQAQSGIMSVTGFPDGPPVKAGPTLVDFMGGIHLYAAVVTALLQRERTGRGAAGRGGDAGDGVFLARLQHGVPCAHRRAPAAHRQPPVGAGQRAVQCVSHRRRLGGDPRRDRGALEEPGEGDGARGTGGRSALRHQRRPRRQSGGDRRRGGGVDADAGQDGGVRAPSDATAFRARRCAPCRR